MNPLAPDHRRARWCGLSIALLAMLACTPDGRSVLDGDPHDADAPDERIDLPDEGADLPDEGADPPDVGLDPPDEGVDPPDAAVVALDGPWQAAPGSAFPTACGPARPVFAGPLCGPGSAPCAVLAEEVVDARRHFRNAAPAIAVTDDGVTEVLYSVAEGPFQGWRATQVGAGDWITSALEADLATGALGIGLDGTIWATAYGGAHDATRLWSWVVGDDGAPMDRGPVTDGDANRANAMVTDGGGCVHVATHGALGWSRFDGTSWHRAVLPLEEVGSPTIRIAGEGHVHFATLLVKNSRWEVAWSLPSGDGEGHQPVETVYAYRDGIRWAQPVHLAIGPATDEMPEGVPHIFARDAGTLRYARRTGAGQWQTTLVTSGASLNDADCAINEETDAEVGSQCVHHEVEVHAFGLVASGTGDVRLIWGETHERATLTAQVIEPDFEGDPFRGTFWTLPDAGFERFTEFFVGDIVDGAVRRGPSLPVDATIFDANVILGTDGTLHVGLYGYTDEGQDVRVMRIGPTP